MCLYVASTTLRYSVRTGQAALSALRLRRLWHRCHGARPNHTSSGAARQPLTFPRGGRGGVCVQAVGRPAALPLRPPPFSSGRRPPHVRRHVPARLAQSASAGGSRSEFKPRRGRWAARAGAWWVPAPVAGGPSPSGMEGRPAAPGPYRATKLVRTTCWGCGAGRGSLAAGSAFRAGSVRVCGAGGGGSAAAAAPGASRQPGPLLAGKAQMSINPSGPPRSGVPGAACGPWGPSR